MAVWQDGLIHKLVKLDIPTKLVRIIRTYVANRKFQVRVEGLMSAPKKVKAGVLQRSCLSSLLFVNYFPKNNKTGLAMYADGTAVIASARRPPIANEKIQKVWKKS